MTISTRFPRVSQPQTISAPAYATSPNAVYWNHGAGVESVKQRLPTQTGTVTTVVRSLGTGAKVSDFNAGLVFTGGLGIGAIVGHRMFYAGCIDANTSGTVRTMLFSDVEISTWSSLKAGQYSLECESGTFSLMLRIATTAASVLTTISTLTVGVPFWIVITYTATGFDYEASFGKGSRTVANMPTTAGATKAAIASCRVGAQSGGGNGHSGATHIAAGVDIAPQISLSSIWQLFTPIQKPLFSAIDSVRIRGPKPRQVVRTMQPQAALESNSANPLTSNLVVLYSPSIPSNIINDRYINTGITKISDKYVTTSTNFGRYDTNVMPGSSSFTVFVLWKPTANSGIVSTSATTNLGYTPWVTMTGTAPNRAITLNVFRHGVLDTRGTVSVTGLDGVFSTAVWSGVGSTVSTYVNGKFLESYATAGAVSGSNLQIGQAGNNAPVGISADIAIIAIWNNRLLSNNEVSELHRNPWQLFANAEQPFWHTEFVQPKKFFPVLALPTPKNITANSVTPQVTLSF